MLLFALVLHLAEDPNEFLSVSQIDFLAFEVRQEPSPHAELLDAIGRQSEFHDAYELVVVVDDDGLDPLAVIQLEVFALPIGNAEHLRVERLFSTTTQKKHIQSYPRSPL